MYSVIARTFSALALRLRWIKTFCSTPVESWLMGARLFQETRYDEASRCFEAGLRDNFFHPASVAARLDLAVCYLRIGRPLDAEEHYRLILSSMPQNREAYRGLCELHFELRNAEKMVRTARRALHQGFSREEFFPFLAFGVSDLDGLPSLRAMSGIPLQFHEGGEKDDLAKLSIGALLLAHGKLLEALSVLGPLTRHEVFGYLVLVKIAETLCALGKAEQAQTVALEGLHRFPHSSRLLCVSAECYLMNGHEDEVELAHFAALEGARLSGWNSKRALRLLSRTFDGLGEKDIALSFLEGERLPPSSFVSPGSEAN